MFWIEMFQAGSGKRVAGSQLRRIPYRHHAEGFSSLAWLYGGNLGVQSLQSSKPKREIPGKFRATGFVTHTSKGGHHDTSETVAQLHDLCAAFPGLQPGDDAKSIQLTIWDTPNDMKHPEIRKDVDLLLSSFKPAP